MSATESTPKPLTKAQDTHDRLLALARQLGPNAKLPTVQQLRRELQVSITTLDGVLTQLEHQNIIQRKHGLGIFVSPRLSQRCVGLVCDPTFFRSGTSPFWQQLVEAARTRATISGEAFRFYLAIPSSDGEVPVHSDLIEDVQSNRIQGVLFVGNNQAAQDWFRAQGVPSVVFAGQGDFLVHIDYDELVMLAGEHLLRQGCRNIALLVPWEAGIEENTTPLGGYQAVGFQKFLERHNLPLRQEWIWEGNALGHRNGNLPESHQEQGFQATLDMFQRNNGSRPDGIISTDDVMTRGVLAALRKLDLHPGQDLHLVSHINRGSMTLQGEDVPLALVEVDPAALVQQMFVLLEKLMDGQQPESQLVMVAPRLVE